MADATDLYALCQELLEASQEALDTIPLVAAGLDGAPGRSFVSPGPPVLDCCNDGQLTVHGQAVTDTNPVPSGKAADGYGWKPMVTLIVTIARCIHVASDEGDAPAVEDLEADADQVHADGWALWNHLWCLWQSGDLFTVCDEVFWDGLRALTPSGGCAGWTLTIRAQLGGYCDAASS